MTAPPGDYSAALYLRLSRDDEGGGNSVSIQTQRMMLERCCREQGLQIHDIYIDDGYSGLNFDRPAFRRMLEDIRRGAVNLVITKDLSRLGRDYLQTGYYTERVFPRQGVRFIALDDGVDTLRDDNDIAPFKNILNDLYARDLSRKVKSAKRARAAQGAFIGSHAPYGYLQRAENRNVLEVNGETAAVVRQIFELALGGMGAAAIAGRLRAERTLTPAAYKVRRGERHFARLFEQAPEEKQYQWAASTVRRILGDRVYLGHMIGHKSQVDHYKTKRRSPVPQGERIVVENTHPALVSREDFDKVQLLIRARQLPKREEGDNLFRALLYCDECGHRLSMAAKTYQNGRGGYYRCMHHYRFPDRCGDAHYIRYDHLYQIALKELERIAEPLRHSADRTAELLAQAGEEAKKELHSREAKLCSRRATVDAIVGRLYEDFGAGRVTAHNHNRLLAEYQREQEAIQKELEALRSGPGDEGKRSARQEELRGAVEKYLTIGEPDAALLHQLIQKIHVGRRERQGEGWVQSIRIEYRFAGETSD